MANSSAPPVYIDEDRPPPHPHEIGTGEETDRIVERLGDIAAMVARDRPLAEVVKEVLRDISELFGIGELLVEMTAEDVQPSLHWATYGIPVARAKAIVENLSHEFVDDEILTMVLSERFRITKNTFYVPSEEWLSLIHSDPFMDHPAYYRNPENVKAPRASADAWHEADSYKFTVRDNNGEVVAVLEASYPSAGKLLSKEILERIELFVEMMAVAVGRERSHVALAKKRAMPSPKTELLEDVLKIASSIVSERDVKKLSEMVLASVSSLFAFRRVELIVYDESEGVFKWRALFGHSPRAQSEVQHKSIPVDIVFEDLAESRKIGRFAYFTKSEQMSPRQKAYVVEPEDYVSITEPRKKDEMRKGDYLAFPLRDSAGRVVGVLYPSDPVGGKIPDAATIETIEIFTSLAEVALENARLSADREQALRLGGQKTEQLSRILDMATGIMYVHDMDQMLDSILKTLARLLGIRRMVIGVKHSDEGVYRIEALYGFSAKAAEDVKKIPYPIHMVDGIVDARPESRRDLYSRWWDKVGRITYYFPAEGVKTLTKEEMAYYPEPELVRMPRTGKGRWHELDYMDTIVSDKMGNPIAYLELLKPRDDRVPDADTIEIIEIFASLAGIAIENARMLQDHIDSRQEAELYTDVLSHDIKNFNQAILGYLELLKSKMDTPDKVSIIDKIAEQVMNTSWLASNVRTMSRVAFTDVELVRTDLGGVLLDCIRSVSQYYPGRKIVVNHLIDRSTHFTMADELIRELFTNILTNAVKYDPHDPLEIDVTIEPVYEDDRRRWRVSIADRGMGVPHDAKPIIFDRFSKAPKKKGSGMGLHIVKTLANRYGGKVWVEDRVQGDCSKGAVFKVELPAV